MVLVVLERSAISFHSEAEPESPAICYHRCWLREGGTEDSSITVDGSLGPGAQCKMITQPRGESSKAHSLCRRLAWLWEGSFILFVLSDRYRARITGERSTTSCSNHVRWQDFSGYVQLLFQTSCETGIV